MRIGWSIPLPGPFRVSGSLGAPRIGKRKRGPAPAKTGFWSDIDKEAIKRHHVWHYNMARNETYATCHYCDWRSETEHYAGHRTKDAVNEHLATHGIRPPYANTLPVGHDLTRAKAEVVRTYDLPGHVVTLGRTERGSYHSLCSCGKWSSIVSRTEDPAWADMYKHLEKVASDLRWKAKEQAKFDHWVDRQRSKRQRKGK